jgi:hypothetical protein
MKKNTPFSDCPVHGLYVKEPASQLRITNYELRIARCIHLVNPKNLDEVLVLVL